MNLLFKTLNEKQYRVKLEKYTAKPFKVVASKFQYDWKRFWMNSLKKDFWAEEFPVRPLLSHKYRADLYNFTRGFMVECHGKQHVEVSNHFHGGSHDAFLDSLVKDREKELWCAKNNIQLITVFESTPKNLDYFINKYTKIKWK